MASKNFLERFKGTFLANWPLRDITIREKLSAVDPVTYERDEEGVEKVKSNLSAFRSAMQTWLKERGNHVSDYTPGMRRLLQAYVDGAFMWGASSYAKRGGYEWQLFDSKNMGDAVYNLSDLEKLIEDMDQSAPRLLMPMTVYRGMRVELAEQFYTQAASNYGLVSVMRLMSTSPFIGLPLNFAGEFDATANRTRPGVVFEISVPAGTPYFMPQYGGQKTVYNKASAALESLVNSVLDLFSSGTRADAFEKYIELSFNEGLTGTGGPADKFKGKEVTEIILPPGDLRLHFDKAYYMPMDWRSLELYGKNINLYSSPLEQKETWVVVVPVDYVRPANIMKARTPGRRALPRVNPKTGKVTPVPPPVSPYLLRPKGKIEQTALAARPLFDSPVGKRRLYPGAPLPPKRRKPLFDDEDEYDPDKDPATNALFGGPPALPIATASSTASSLSTASTVSAGNLWNALYQVPQPSSSNPGYDPNAKVLMADGTYYNPTSPTYSPSDYPDELDEGTTSEQFLAALEASSKAPEYSVPAVVQWMKDAAAGLIKA